MTQRDKSFYHFVELFDDECSFSFEVSDATYFYVCNGEKSQDKFDGKLNFSSTLVSYITKNSWIDLKVEEMKMLLESDQIPAINKSCEHCAYLKGGKAF